MEIGVDYIGVGVGGLIINNLNQILLFMRKKKPEAGCWSIPGGRVNFGEKIENALVRELYEELGVKVKVIQLLQVADHIISDENLHWISPAYLVEITSGEPVNKATDEHSDMKWISIDKLPKNITITTKSAVESYKAKYYK